MELYEYSLDNDEDVKGVAVKAVASDVSRAHANMGAIRFICAHTAFATYKAW